MALSPFVAAETGEAGRAPIRGSATSPHFVSTSPSLVMRRRGFHPSRNWRRTAYCTSETSCLLQHRLPVSPCSCSRRALPPRKPHRPYPSRRRSNKSANGSKRWSSGCSRSCPRCATSSPHARRPRPESCRRRPLLHWHPVSGAAPGRHVLARSRERRRRQQRPDGRRPQGFLAIPGTPARVKVDGYAKLDTIVRHEAGGQPRPVYRPARFRSASLTRSGPRRRTAHSADSVNLDFRQPDGARGVPQLRRARFLRRRRPGRREAPTFLRPDRQRPDRADMDDVQLDAGRISRHAGPLGAVGPEPAAAGATPGTLTRLAAGQSLALAIERPITQAPAGLGDSGAS